MPLYPDIYAAILIGGRGRRLGGRDKTQLPALGGKTTLARIVEELSGNVATVAVVGRRDQSVAESASTYIADGRSECGPLAGLESALRWDAQPWCFLLACDMPAFDMKILRKLAEARGSGAGAIVPRSTRGIEPTCALYHRDALSTVSAHLDGGRLALRALLDAVTVTYVDFDEQLSAALRNVNTPDDL